MSYYKNGQEQAKAGGFRNSEIRREKFSTTREWLDAMREWYAGYDGTTEAGENPALTTSYSAR